MRTTPLVVAALLAVLALLALPACGGTPQRAAMPDVASTDQSADDMGLPAVTPPEQSAPSEVSEPASEPAPTVVQ